MKLIESPLRKPNGSAFVSRLKKKLHDWPKRNGSDRRSKGAEKKRQKLKDSGLQRKSAWRPNEEAKEKRRRGSVSKKKEEEKRKRKNCKGSERSRHKNRRRLSALPLKNLKGSSNRNRRELPKKKD